MVAPTLVEIIHRPLVLPFLYEPPTFMTMDSARRRRWRLPLSPILSSRYPKRKRGTQVDPLQPEIGNI